MNMEMGEKEEDSGVQCLAITLGRVSLRGRLVLQQASPINFLNEKFDMPHAQSIFVCCLFFWLNSLPSFTGWLIK